MSQSDQIENRKKDTLSRRSFLRYMAAGSASIVGAGIIAACGGGGGGGGTTSTGASSSTGGSTAAPGGSSGSTGASGVSGGSSGTSGVSGTSGGSSMTPGMSGGSSMTPGISGTSGGSSMTPGMSGTSGASGGSSMSFSKSSPPAVANVSAAKKYSGQKITYYGDAVAPGSEADAILAKKFSQDTGIQVNVVQRPKSTTDAYAQFLRLFQAKSPDMDVLGIDVINTGAFAPFLADLSKSLKSRASQINKDLISNSTVSGKIVSMPWFADFGMLHYRTDLLKKYGYSSPPQTWTDLASMAKKVQQGEQKSNNSFQGFVFQGDAYEGLTCDALEWVASYGGGTFVDPNGKVTVNNPKAIAALNEAKSWVGSIAPQGVTTYQETESENIFKAGNAAFLRNWPYAYADLKGSKVDGKYAEAPLPHGPGGKSVATIGGWGLGVSQYSDAQQASIEFVNYLTSPQVQAWRAVVYSYVPTMDSLANNPAVKKAQPFLSVRQKVTLVGRPSRGLGAKYNQASTAIFNTVNQILRGQDAQSGVQSLESQLQSLTS